MGSLKPLHDHLKELRSQAKGLIKASLALNTLFAEERTRLSREDEASSLRALYRSIVEQLQRVEGIEASASCGYSRASLTLGLGGLALTALVSRRNRLSAITDYLSQSPLGKQPFGLVMVCIGPRGLPEDVQVVAISRLARESNRPEHEIISKLRKNGYLLFSGEAFSFLIDGVVSDIREGRLHLPISKLQLTRIRSSSILKIVPVETKPM
ncbi:hypothetical protein ACFLUK_01745 [Chloroflexota bacterium]